MRQTVALKRSAKMIIETLLAVRPGEQVAIVCDPRSEMQMVQALAWEAEAAGAECTILTMPVRARERSNELTRIIERGLEGADCLIGLTGASGAPTYSGAVKRLFRKKSLRAISMVFRDMRHFTEGGALADYRTLLKEGQRLRRIWAGGGTMRVQTPAGTDIQAPVAHDDVIVECGFATEPGQEAAFSDGEVSSRPLEGKAEGVVVADGPICHLGMPDEPIRLTVERGRVRKVEGESRQALELRRIVTTIDNADNIAEFGIGLNPCSLRNGDFEEEKKARGLVHIALGDNQFYGGSIQSAVHMDMVVYAPTVTLDGRTLVEAGNLRLEQTTREEKDGCRRGGDWPTRIP